MKKTLQRIGAFMLAAFCSFALTSGAFAATVADATIDTTRTGSISIYKYDTTQAEKDGAWNPANYKPTGQYDASVNAVLGANVAHDLGNGQTSYGYAVKGVKFTYLKVADFRTYSETESGTDQVILLYGIDQHDSLLSILGLTAADRYTLADNTTDNYYFKSDTLIAALANVLQTSTNTAKKSALEAYVLNNGGTTMTETDAYGYTTANRLPLGLYLLVETYVPEMVTSTVDPFFISVPMTDVSGGLASGTDYLLNGTVNNDGGVNWLYDITVYPKNQTGIPSLEKTVREASYDTGKNRGATDDITDGYAHTATGSAGDVMQYQIISTLPTITSDSTKISDFHWVDTIDYGIEYKVDDGVKIEIFRDKACTEKIATWLNTDASPKFTVTYTYNATDGYNTMTIRPTVAGYAEINTAEVSGQSILVRGYSDFTIRITYNATIRSDARFVLGDTGNDNRVTLTWARSNQDYYDQLIDDCHVYSYGIDLTKQFSDNAGHMNKVEFLVYNSTDEYYIQAEYNSTEQVYYVVDNASAADHRAAEAVATHFVPTTAGKVIIKGLEDDTYIITEVRTDDGYTLLKDNITVVISTANVADNCTIYSNDTRGVVQNDARWTSLGQAGLSHKELTSSSTVDTNSVTMGADDTSVNAYVPIRVLNTKGFTLPQTGGTGNWMFPAIGIGMVAVAVFMVLVAKKKGNENENAG